VLTIGISRCSHEELSVEDAEGGAEVGGARAVVGQQDDGEEEGSEGQAQAG
jgi:hypothetical protein